MNRIVVGAPSVECHGVWTELSAPVEIGGEQDRMWFRVPSDVPVHPRLEPFIVSLFSTAMHRQADFEVTGELSPALIEGLHTVQTIYTTWYPDSRRFTVRGYRPGVPPAAPGLRVASFFSGGVDAFHTALRHRETVTDLVLVHGFDIPLVRTALRQRISASLRHAAAGLGKRLIEVETNSREITERHVSWTYQQFGNALIGVGHALGGTVRRVLIPSSETYRHLDPLGSHPMTDPHLGSECLAVTHDSADRTRDEKTDLVATSDTALQHLRVCFKNPDDTYNCGRCEKCVRTMLNLLAAGALDRCTAFPLPLTPTLIHQVEIPADIVLYHAEANLKRLEARGTDPSIILAVRDLVLRYRQHMAGRTLGALSRLDTRSPELVEAITRHEQELMGILLGRGHANLFRLWARLIKAGFIRRLQR